MTIQDIAADLVALCKAGDYTTPGEKYWADDVVSIEAAPGPMSRIEGKDNVRGKGEWWAANHEVHGAEVTGPYINGDQFVVGFKMDITPKSTGERITMDEVGLYTIKDGKIVEEKFFY